MSSPHPQAPWCKWGLWFLGLAPVVFLVAQVAANLRNIVYWDEFETALSYLVDLDRHASWPVILEKLFAVQNEHRIVTSRLLYLLLRATTGTLDFVFIGVLGDAFLLGTAVLLLVFVGKPGQRAPLAALLGLGLFHLEHYENLFWAGSSIDHFHVVLLATGAFVLLTRESRLGLWGALLLGLLGSYTLVHGFVIWPVGAGLLAGQRRWRHLGVWLLVAATAVICYFPGFFFNPGHHVETSVHAGSVFIYWLALLGAAPALGDAAVAPWLGACLVGAGFWLMRQRRWKDERVAAAVVAFCVIAMMLMALGRTGLAGAATLTSRYIILSSLAWTLTAWVAWTSGEISAARRGWLFASLVVAFGAVNVAADVRFGEKGKVFKELREQVALRYHFSRTLEGAPFKLYPNAALGDRILVAAEERGIYRLPLPEVKAITLGHERLRDGITCALDGVQANAHAVYVDGWAATPRGGMPPGEPAVVFVGDSTVRAFHALRIRRPDVVQAKGNAELLFAGFRVVVPRAALPPENYRIGALFRGKDSDACVLTASTVDLRTAPVNAPSPAEKVTLRAPREIPGVVYFVESVRSDDEAVEIDGWAFLPKREGGEREMAVVFQSEDSRLAFRARRSPRLDVAQKYPECRTLYAGFHLHLPRSELPKTHFRLGLSFKQEDEEEFILTDHRVDLAPEPALLGDAARVPLPSGVGG
ncbi:hypothetical protein K0B96_01230 [Horticoccus luteus]|uniref:Uncharacterized protein n=1 Tax=Horticoccus luteus TaxID=2862869 RepID=A0A8F9XLQ5_9BACT|nr:hypothetical protein [Horticoccus luteus]QYM79269.1 hypothetical protein K0B96_01230 [Horticoccus luteus]